MGYTYIYRFSLLVVHVINGDLDLSHGLHLRLQGFVSADPDRSHNH